MTATMLHPARKTSPMVRGACPALSTPMMTGDGFLARIGLDGAISPENLVRIGELAKRHGNGLIDISARGNFQVRGLTAASARALEADILRMNLLLRDGVPVETGALAGLDPHEVADPEPLASAVRAFISEHGLSRRLAAKFSVVVDGGGQLPLHGLLADIRLVAMRREDGLFWRVFLGGTAMTGRSIGLVADKAAKTATTLVLARIAAMDVPLRGRALDSAEVREWLGDMVIEGDEVAIEQSALAFGLFQFANAKAADENSPSGLPAISPTRGEMAGSNILPRSNSEGTDGLSPPPCGEGWEGSSFMLEHTVTATRNSAARIGIPFGQCPTETLIALGQHAKTVGITKIRPAIDHSLLFFGSEDSCRAIIELSQGLILSQNDPRAKIAACPGKPACHSACLQTHALGEIAAGDIGDVLDGSFTLHLSGCSKGCAHSAAALLNLVGMNEGTALIFGGKTSDMPLKLIRHGEEAKTLAGLAQLVRLERGTGETTRDCLLRLGPARLEKALSQGLS